MTSLGEPRQEVPIPYRASFSLEEFEVVRRGLEPRDMDDKWRIRMEDGWLVLQRSWTGFTVYRVQFELDGERWLATNALVSANRAEYRRLDDTYEVAMLDFLIRWHLLHQDVEFPLPPGLEGREAIYQHHVSGTAARSRPGATTPAQGLARRALAWLMGLARRRPPVLRPLPAPDGPPPAAEPLSRVKPSLRRYLALHGSGTLEERVDATAYALLAALQEIDVLKSMMRERGLWDDTLYRTLRIKRMLRDHDTDGAIPFTYHSDYPFTLDEHEFLRYAFRATSEDLARYDADVESVNR